MVPFLKRGRKLINVCGGGIQEPRMGLFKDLLALCEICEHVNQYK